MVGVFDPGAVMRELADREVTVTNLVPTMLSDLVNDPQAAGIELPSFRLVMSGGAPISIEVLPVLFAEMERRGLRSVPVSELLGG